MRQRPANVKLYRRDDSPMAVRQGNGGGQGAGQLIVGRLQEHGRANYQFLPGQDRSYYAKIVTSQGLRVLWGKDIERAIFGGWTKPAVGDLIGARRADREAVTIRNRTRDEGGNILSERQQQTYRIRWEVEKLQFFAERARQARLARDAHIDTREAVRQRPELRSAFLSLRAAELVAARRIKDPQDREKFIDMLRLTISESVRRGEPLPDVQLRDKSRSHASRPVVPRKRDRDEPTR